MTGLVDLQGRPMRASASTDLDRPHEGARRGGFFMKNWRSGGLRSADADWQSIEFMQLTVNPTQEWRERPKLGVPGTRHNVLDPIKPRKAFFRVAAELVIDMDSRQLPIWLRHAVGAPAAPVANGDLYDHVWSSGSKDEMYFDLQVKVGATDVRIYEGLTLASLSANVAGENTQDFDGKRSAPPSLRSWASAR